MNNVSILRLRRNKSVSYTHLDVYKRQQGRRDVGRRRKKL